MRNIYFILFAFCFGFSLNAQIINFPDLGFKAKLLEADVINNQIAMDSNNIFLKIDSNDDGEIDVNEALEVNSLYLYGNTISSIEGIAYFSNLTSLYCIENQLVNLNLTGLNNLTQFTCQYNNLITSIDLSSLTNLLNVSCTNNNQLNNLNVNGLVNLQDLRCSSNNLSTLDVNDLINLKILIFYNNNISSIDLHNLILLESLETSLNPLSNIDVSQNINLEVFSCVSNNLSQLNFLQNQDLIDIRCDYNNLTSLNVTQNIGLTNISCSSNQLTELDLSQNINLISLDIETNYINSLELSNNSSLNWLDCGSNQLTNLFIKNGITESFIALNNNPNLQYVCADTAQIIQVQDIVATYGYTNCVVNSNCSLANQDFDFVDYFSINPNPAKDILTIQTKENVEVSSINIYNTLGQLVLLIPNAKDISTIDVSSLKKGNYFIKVLSDKGVSSTKFIKE
ncbi:MAG: T9SS type A sorting domain-containing protein [Flavobacterium sp.]|uniref:T9SS type A sorting domain-containing protein n=1 Tax=Flavobacterium sp. TaxID=239 RepID=UPI0022BC59EB|nr:T9SS type A sorting domain-containing protein [Flavobacterium sp.]MCZ8196704.1 T9SS type A sorting domain-containing protein [Flavobacterium sp.]